MNFEIGGIYTSEFSTFIIISKSKKAYFMIKIKHFSNHESVINILKSLDEVNTNFRVSKRNFGCLNHIINGYLGQIPEYLLSKFENLLVDTNLYQNLK